MRNSTVIWILVLLFAAFMSIPWLVPHAGAFALVAFVPLLVAEDFATQLRVKHFWWYHYTAFVLWNAATVFWVCNATVGGGIFAVFANALEMSFIFQLFRLSRRRFKGILPYVFLASMWIAWEWWILEFAQISWPWLVLGNAFSESTKLIQWYDCTGTLGGSLWVWLSNLGIFGMVCLLSETGRRRPSLSKILLAGLTVTAVIAGPSALSLYRYSTYMEVSEGSVDVLVGQPDFDPYQKFETMSQSEQTDLLLSLYDGTLERSDSDILLIAPETFTSDVRITSEGIVSPTLDRFRQYLDVHPNTSLLFGASAVEMVGTRSKPSPVAKPFGDGWYRSRNSAIMLNPGKDPEIFHKSKLVVGTELTPYPSVFVPIDEWLSSKMGVGGLIARCEGQDHITPLHYGDVPFGCAVCYESVFGDYCTGYVREGAKMLAVITNDAWWGDTPGYRQHLSYSRLRAIELRRDIARCANTGISAFINQKGDIVSRSSWWEKQTLRGKVNLNSKETFYVRFGDIVGPSCAVLFAVILLVFLTNLAFVRPSPTGRA